MTGRGGSAAANVQIIEQMGVVADLFNSLIAMVLVLGANAISRRVSSTSLF
jgi:putative aldouronate transport system permease protein